LPNMDRNTASAKNESAKVVLALLWQILAEGIIFRIELNRWRGRARAALA
jgi:hypothetical protein